VSLDSQPPAPNFHEHLERKCERGERGVRGERGRERYSGLPIAALGSALSAVLPGFFIFAHVASVMWDAPHQAACINFQG